ncbi:hypothetical protein [Candidatus Thiosymbion oneisti]|uniref:hypothetical protein n=1 Tax=Candidatus Thiosymbion oneisti TaxID=589554 RepID=UPI00105E1E73|nr:hypothetical protein [Candidatus Thiosymbion oneisti]
MAEQGNEEKKTIQFSVNLPKSLIGLGSELVQVLKGSFLVFLIVLALSIPGTFWLLPKYMEQRPILYIYIAVLGVSAVLGMWAYLATVRQNSLFATVRQERDSLRQEREKDSLLANVLREKDDLLVERDKLVKDLQDARDDHQRCEDNLRCCLEGLTKRDPQPRLK